MATASLVFGLLWLGGAGSLAAVLCGHRSRRQIDRHHQPGRGRAAVGIRLGWLGLVATSVMVVLVVYTPEQLAHQLSQVEGMIRHFFDDRSAFD